MYLQVGIHLVHINRNSVPRFFYFIFIKLIYEERILKRKIISTLFIMLTNVHETLLNQTFFYQSVKNSNLHGINGINKS